MRPSKPTQHSIDRLGFFTAVLLLVACGVQGNLGSPHNTVFGCFMMLIADYMFVT